jgi:hypothetical protein
MMTFARLPSRHPEVRSTTIALLSTAPKDLRRPAQRGRAPSARRLRLLNMPARMALYPLADWDPGHGQSMTTWATGRRERGWRTWVSASTWTNINGWRVWQVSLRRAVAALAATEERPGTQAT